MLWVGPERFVFRQSQGSAVILGKRLLIGAIFGEGMPGDDDSVVIANAPQPRIEQPVSVLAQGHSVRKVVVARVGELVDVGGAGGQFYSSIVRMLG